MSMRAFGYFRESPKRRQTLADQNKRFLEFCDREGYEVAGTFADGPGSNGKSPGFRQLLATLREPEREFAVVVVPAMDVLGDDLPDAVRRYFQLEGLGARVAAITGAPDPLTDLAAVWRSEHTDNGLADRVRAAMRRKAVRGEVLGRPPYGYKVNSRHRLELIPEEAVVVRYIFRLYLQEGIGIRLIARRLNEEGLRTRRGGSWSMVSIRDILRNRAYLGTYARFGVRVPGSHPQLVQADEFRAAQDHLDARRTSHAPRVTSQFLLSGLTFCGYCKNKLIGVSRKQSWKRRDGERVSNSYRYYQCESRTNQSMCGYHTRRADALEAEVWTKLNDLLAAGSGVPRVGDQAAVMAEHEQQCARLRARLRAIDKRLARYVEAAARGRLTAEKMRALSSSAAADGLGVEDALEAAEARSYEQASSVERKRRREHDLATLLERKEKLKFVDRQAGLREAVDRVIVADDHIEIMMRS